MKQVYVIQNRLTEKLVSYVAYTNSMYADDKARELEECNFEKLGTYQVVTLTINTQ